MTTKLRHTPGKWYLHNDSDTYSHYRIEADGWGVIAHVKDVSNESEANAHLKAAAPDLLAALEKLLSSQKTLQGYTDTDKSLSPLVAHGAYFARTQAEEAIAKATGGTEPRSEGESK